MVDTSKKSNIKCEHCYFWNGCKCDNQDSKKWNTHVHYWNRCKEFYWNERIKQEIKMREFAIAELEKLKEKVKQRKILPKTSARSDYEMGLTDGRSTEKVAIKYIIEKEIAKLKGDSGNENNTSKR